MLQLQQRVKRHGIDGARVEKREVRVCASVVLDISTKRIPAMTTPAELPNTWWDDAYSQRDRLKERRKKRMKGKGEKPVTTSKSKNSKI
jgi:hypothetical protein